MSDPRDRVHRRLALVRGHRRARRRLVHRGRWRDRPARAQRRRQVDDAQAVRPGSRRRAAASCASSGSTRGARPPCFAGSASSPTTARRGRSCRRARWSSSSARLHRVDDFRAAAAAAIETVGLEDAADRPVGEFSHGMRQRVKLAQALAHDPELLLLDEPLNGLDPAQRSHVIELLTRLGHEGRTVIVSSHVLHEVERMAPRVLVLVNGHLVAEGATDAIRQADQRAAAAGAGERRRQRPGARAGAARPGRRRCRAARRRNDRDRDQRPDDARVASCRWPRSGRRRSCAGSARSETTSRACTPTCTSAPGGRRGDRPGLHADPARAAAAEAHDRARRWWPPRRR